MTGPTGNWHRARRRHLRICREDAWGQCPASPDWQTVPIFGDGHKLKATGVHFQPKSQFGGSKRTTFISDLLTVRGRLVTLPWPEVTEFLLKMAFDRDGDDLHSYCMDHYTPADPRRHLGAVVEGMRIQGSAAAGEVEFRVDLRAQSEETNPALDENDFDYSGLSPVPFVFDRAQITFGGATVTGAEEFRITVANNISAGPNVGGSVAWLLAAQRAVALELGKLDDSDAFNDALRDGGTLSFQATLGHPDGHTLALNLPALRPESGDESAAPGRLARAALRMQAIADQSGDDITYALNMSS